MILEVRIEALCELFRAAWQAQSLANKLELTVEFSFNGVLCVVVPGGDPARLWHEYRQLRPGPTRQGEGGIASGVVGSARSGY